MMNVVLIALCSVLLLLLACTAYQVAGAYV